MPNESAVIGFTGTWDGYDFIFQPQNTPPEPPPPTVNPGPIGDVIDPEAALEVSGDYLIGLTGSASADAVTTVAGLKEMFNLTAGQDIKVFSSAGAELTSSDAVGTGMIMRLYEGTVETGSIILVVKGDLTGNGMIGFNDLLTAVRAYNETRILTPWELKTADDNGNGKVDFNELLWLVRNYS